MEEYSYNYNLNKIQLWKSLWIIQTFLNRIVDHFGILEPSVAELILTDHVPHKHLWKQQWRFLYVLDFIL